MAANGLLPKFTAGFGVFLAGVILTAAHFPTHAAAGSVGPEVMRHMSLLYLPFATGMKVLSVAVLLFYRIDKDTHERNLATLADAAAVGEVADIEEARPASVGAGAPIA